MPTNDDYDFGFSFADDDGGSTTPPQSNDELKALQEKVDTLLGSQTQLLEEKYKAKYLLMYAKIQLSMLEMNQEMVKLRMFN